jgi:hypothetical protein
MSEELFLTFWTEMETTLEEEDEVVADGIREVRALEVLVRGPQGRGSTGSQKQTAVSENGDDDLRDSTAEPVGQPLGRVHNLRTRRNEQNKAQPQE